MYKRRINVPFLYSAAITLLVLFYGQGSRLIPTLGIFLLLTFLAENTNASSTTSTGRFVASRTALILLLVALPYYVYYLPVYWGNLSLDLSYTMSDEAIVSEYLSLRVPAGYRVYVMYGDMFHGNQWINVFHPELYQVLSDFQEGCLKSEVFELDYLIKNSLDTRSIIDLVERLRVRYLLVDKE